MRLYASPSRSPATWSSAWTRYDSPVSSSAHCARRSLVSPTPPAKTVRKAYSVSMRSSVAGACHDHSVRAVRRFHLLDDDRDRFRVDRGPPHQLRGALHVVGVDRLEEL